MKSKTEGVLTVKRGSVIVKVYSRLKKVGERQYRVYEVADYSGGSRRLLSFSDKTKAIAEAKRISHQLRVGEAGALCLGSNDCAEYVRAKRHIRPTGMALDVVAAQYAELWRKLKGNRHAEAVDYFVRHCPRNLPNKTVSDAVAQFIETKASSGRSQLHLRDLKYRLGAFADHFQVQLVDVRGPDIQKWLANLKQSPQSKEHFRSKVGALFRWAKRQRYLPSDWDELAAVDRVRVVRGEVTIFTAEEMARLLAVANQKFLGALALQAFAGLRTAEVERLYWSEVDLEESVIKISATIAKTASRRTIPIQPNLKEWLGKCRNRRGKIWKGGRTTICHAQKATAAATASRTQAAIKWKHNALRHSYISYRLAVLKDANQVALEAGNSPTSIHRHYKELVTQAEGKAWFELTPDGGANPKGTGRLTH